MKSRRELQICVGLHPNRTEDVIEVVEKYFNIPFAMMQHRTRRREVCYARQVCMYFLCKKTHNSLKSIGEMFGGRDHTSVIHARELIKDLIDTNEQTKKDIDTLSDKL